MLISIDLPGIKREDNSRVIVEEAYAICDNGDTLHLKEANWQLFRYEDPSVFLELPDRTVNTIAAIEGKVKVFVPSEENESRILIKSRELRKQNENILANHDVGIKMLVLDNTKIDTYLDELLPAYKKYIHETDKLSSEEKDDLLFWWEFIESNGRGISKAEHFIQFISVEEEGDLMSINIYDEEEQSLINNTFNLSASVYPALEQLLGIERFKFKELNYTAFEFQEGRDVEDYTVELIIENEASTKVYSFSMQNITLP